MSKGAVIRPRKVQIVDKEGIHSSSSSLHERDSLGSTLERSPAVLGRERASADDDDVS